MKLIFDEKTEAKDREFAGRIIPAEYDEFPSHLAGCESCQGCADVVQGLAALGLHTLISEQEEGTPEMVAHLWAREWSPKEVCAFAEFACANERHAMQLNMMERQLAALESAGNSIAMRQGKAQAIMTGAIHYDQAYTYRQLVEAVRPQAERLAKLMELGANVNEDERRIVAAWKISERGR